MTDTNRSSRVSFRRQIERFLKIIGALVEITLPEHHLRGGTNDTQCPTGFILE